MLFLHVIKISWTESNQVGFYIPLYGFDVDATEELGDRVVAVVR